MIQLSEAGTELVCSGRWVLANLADLHRSLKSLSKKISTVVEVNLREVTEMDTAGALFLSDLVKRLRETKKLIRLVGLKNKFEPLYRLVTREDIQLQREILPKRKNAFSIIGRWAYDKFRQLTAFLSFIGELLLVFLQYLIRPGQIYWRGFFRILDESGYRALPIVGLMSFLIGVVLAYQLTTELRVYGATLFVVDVSGVAILREFAPLITAIIIAGRTSTAFAALIGTMKVNEEIDALRTLGIGPLERLVLPRIFGLIAALPLLTVWASVFGILGSMVMAKALVDLNYLGYLHRFSEVVALKQLILGMIKTPVFAVIIAAVGCFQGFQTGSSAESVGAQTTKSAVQAIFLIIVADAAFSILFSMMEL